MFMDFYEVMKSYNIHNISQIRNVQYDMNKSVNFLNDFKYVAKHEEIVIINKLGL